MMIQHEPRHGVRVVRIEYLGGREPLRAELGVPLVQLSKVIILSSQRVEINRIAHRSHGNLRVGVGGKISRLWCVERVVEVVPQQLGRIVRRRNRSFYRLFHS